MKFESLNDNSPIGSIYLNEETGEVWVLVDKVGTTATWVPAMPMTEFDSKMPNPSNDKNLSVFDF